MKKKKPIDSSMNEKAKQILDLALTLNQASNIDEILLDLGQKIIDFCHAEGVSIYAYDHTSGELYSRSKIRNTVEEIRIPISYDSVAGYAAKTGLTINLSDPYEPDSLIDFPRMKFDDSWDKRTGFKTRSLLAVPMNYRNTGLQGVIELVNTQKGSKFNKTDMELLSLVANAVAVALYNQNRFFPKPGKFDFLLETQIISRDELNRAIEYARDHRDHPLEGDVTTVLMERFNVQKDLLGKALSDFFNTPFIPFSSTLIIPSELLEGLNENYLRKNFWVPLDHSKGTLTILIDDPNNAYKINEIKRSIDAHDYDFHVGLRKDILEFIESAKGRLRPKEDISTLIGHLKSEDGEIQFLDTMDNLLNEDAPAIVRTINKIIRDAIEQKVSDVHIEPYANRKTAVIRFRRDGVCFKYTEIPFTHTRTLVNRIKIMCRLKVDEHKIPQSGKMKLQYGSKDIELRIEITPTYGANEDVVMRLLPSGAPMLLKHLNLSQSNLLHLEKIIAKPYGIILVVGPTGSGKTATLHSILGQLNTEEKKIWTAEDPVEITQYGLRQVQINPYFRPEPYSFSKAMRSFLRADPDIIMVGEMRDQETAAIAIEASLTGHLVLSTLHTNSAAETITRLVEMKINTINLSDALLGVLAQRLVRLLCPLCKSQTHPTQVELETIRELYGPKYFPELGINYDDNFVLYEHRGCDGCHNTGYRGRTAIHELIICSDNIKALIRQGGLADQIKSQALQEGMRTLLMDGLQKVLRGETDLSQVLKVCMT
ncbi:MAG: hypothetical protein C0403_10865 [Desulfobacterium sp.]|nr:hypothetical protein [Desulfobacterium sp.]